MVGEGLAAVPIECHVPMRMRMHSGAWPSAQCWVLARIKPSMKLTHKPIL